MEPRRFDALTTRLSSSRLSRRNTLQGTAIIVAAASPLRATAQDAATPVVDGVTLTPGAFLFVQAAASGTFAANPAVGTPMADGTPVAGGGADYLLTLEGHTGNTVYFSDRPERIFGEAPTQTVLDNLGFGIVNPPNAALVTNDADGNEDILVVELVEPTYDAATGTVTYGVNILSDYEGSGLAHVAGRQQDEDLAPTFGEASLFIDDCPDANPLDCLFACGDSVGNLGDRGMCWHWSDASCEPCSGGWDGTAQECNDQFSACNGQCFTDWHGCTSF